MSVMHGIMQLWKSFLRYRGEADLQLRKGAKAAGKFTVKAAWNTLKKARPNFVTDDWPTYIYSGSFSSDASDYWPQHPYLYSLSKGIAHEDIFREYLKLYSRGSREMLRQDWPLFTPLRVLVLEGHMRIYWCIAVTYDIPAAVPAYRPRGAPPTAAEWDAITECVASRRGKVLELTQGKRACALIS